MLRKLRLSGLVGLLLLLVTIGVCGASEWVIAIGGSDDDYAWSIQQTSDGGYILAGYTESFGSSNDAWILKLDANGNVQWQKAYGGTSYDWGILIQQTSDGGYIVAGETNSFGSGWGDAWILKLDANGNVEWQKAYGGSNYDWANSIQQTSDGGYIVAGETYSFGSGFGDAWILKLDANGNVEWQKAYGGSNRDDGNSIQRTSDGGYILAGYTESFGSSNDAWILKLDSNGDIQSCDIVMQTNANLQTTQATITNTNANALTTSASPISTTAQPTATSAHISGLLLPSNKSTSNSILHLLPLLTGSWTNGNL